jgi:hypothetical protein
LNAVTFASAIAGLLANFCRRNVSVHGEPVERAVLQRVALPADAGQRAFGEVVRVDDDRSAAGQVGKIRLEGGRVHRDEDVGTVARGQDVVIGEVQLERRDAGQRAGRSPDLSGEVGQRRQVVAEGGGLLGEPIAGQLHAVAGVARNSDDDTVELLDVLGHQNVPPPCSPELSRANTPAASVSVPARASRVPARTSLRGKSRIAPSYGGAPRSTRGMPHERWCRRLWITSNATARNCLA